MAAVKALVYDRPGTIEWREHPDPAIREQTDIILRVTTTTLCGTDVHVLNGGVPDAPPGTVLGHEGVGIVEEVGSAVRNVAPGDRVLATAMTACGSCPFCTARLYGQCVHGGWKLGHTIDGAQAEYVRIPFAQNSVYKVPPELTDEQVVLLPCIFITGYDVGVLLGQVSPGDTVAIVGAGPVGLATTLVAQLFSPATIVAVDPIESRRQKALEVGATHAVSPEEAGAVVADLTGGLGADVTIEAAGFPAPFELAVELVRPGGRIVNIGVHEQPVTLHMEKLWSMGVTLATGIPNGLSIPRLMRAISSGGLDVTSLITHRLPLEKIEEAYDVFTHASETNALKVVLSA
ncbi:MAG TPA: alcohol dehydrogenase catalytic domain-containing protein [Gaiellaceae bacterium]